jgi:hypothetical protein
LGAARTNPSTVDGWLHGVPDRGSMSHRSMGAVPTCLCRPEVR